MSEWISTKERLPDPGKYVVARHNRGAWRDSSDQENVNCIVVKRVIGLSIEDRRKMESGEIKPIGSVNTWSLSGGYKSTPRHRLYRSEDEHGNNLVPYNWEQFGPDNFFGQSITHWMPLPDAPQE